MSDDLSSSMPDMGSLFGMAMEMQQQLQAAQAEAARRVVEGQAGGGVVRVEVTGGLEFRSVTIAPEAVDPDDVDMLQDLVLAALHDAMAQVSELNQAGNPLAGLDLGGLDLGGVDLSDLDLSGLGLGGPGPTEHRDDDSQRAGTSPGGPAFAGAQGSRADPQSIDRRALTGMVGLGEPGPVIDNDSVTNDSAESEEAADGSFPGSEGQGPGGS